MAEKNFLQDFLGLNYKMLKIMQLNISNFQKFVQLELNLSPILFFIKLQLAKQICKRQMRLKLG